VISTATAIRSTASILVETPDLNGEWRARFHNNIDGDSARLAQSSQALLGLLDVEAAGVEDDATSAVEQAEAVWATRGYHLQELEAGQPVVWPTAPSGSVAQILAGWTASSAGDAARLPLAQFGPAAAQLAYDPARLAARFSVSLDVVLRRLAQLEAGSTTPPMGLVRCDGAGVVTFQKPVLDFRLPRAGAACPLWPLYQALSQPGRAVRAVVRMAGPARTPFECFATASPIGNITFDAEPLYEAVMLVRPSRTDEIPRIVGPGCRIWSVQDCASRRQPSVLSAALAL
jgi:predicted transcriptional regulator